MNKTIGALLLGVTVLAWGCSRTEETPEASESSQAGRAARSEDDKIVYAIGAQYGKNIVKPLRLSEAELEVLLEGIAATARGGEGNVSIKEYGDQINEFLQARAAAGAAEEKDKAGGYLETAAAEEGAQLSESGLVYRTLQPGDGPSPAATDTVKVHYQGTFPDGEVFDSSRDRGEPIEFALTGVIACWTEGVQKMKVGETARLVCPSDIAYGDAGRPGIPGGSTLIFEVELLGIKGK
jgi:FKBP-type peptidyl-prolyl cis-trans isomerase FkpA